MSKGTHNLQKRSSKHGKEKATHRRKQSLAVGQKKRRKTKSFLEGKGRRMNMRFRIRQWPFYPYSFIYLFCDKMILIQKDYIVLTNVIKAGPDSFRCIKKKKPDRKVSRRGLRVIVQPVGSVRPPVGPFSR